MPAIYKMASREPFRLYVASAFRRTGRQVRLKPDTTYSSERKTALVQPEGVQHVAGGGQNILLAVERVGLGRVRHSPEARVPERRAVGRIERDEVAAAVSGEEQSAGRGQHSGGPAAAGQFVPPRDLGRLRIDG